MYDVCLNWSALDFPSCQHHSKLPTRPMTSQPRITRFLQSNFHSSPLLFFPHHKSIPTITITNTNLSFYIYIQSNKLTIHPHQHLPTHIPHNRS